MDAVLAERTLAATAIPELMFMVTFHVLRMTRNQFKVFRRAIELVMINVVNYLISLEASTQFFLHDEPMYSASSVSAIFPYFKLRVAPTEKYGAVSNLRQSCKGTNSFLNFLSERCWFLCYAERGKRLILPTLPIMLFAKTTSDVFSSASGKRARRNRSVPPLIRSSDWMKKFSSALPKLLSMFLAVPHGLEISSTIKEFAEPRCSFWSTHNEHITLDPLSSQGQRRDCYC